MANKKLLNELTEYQEGTVASRTLLKKDTGTVTFFAFDKGEGLSEHTAPYEAMVYISDGEAIVMISGTEHRLKAGETITMPANEPHSVLALERFKMLLIMIRS